MTAIKTKRVRGQALVEFAIILPILLILSMCIIQYGIIMYTMVGLTNLTREGARFAATEPLRTDAEIRARMIAVRPPTIAESAINASTVTITPAQGNVARGIGTRALIRVQMNYDLRNKMFLPSSFFGVQVFNTSYTSSTQMMIE